jgi:hypothetical protein
MPALPGGSERLLIFQHSSKIYSYCQKSIKCFRNPLNVVASLRMGKVVKIESILGACNIWNEAVTVIQTLKKAYPNRVYEVKYEDLTTIQSARNRKD